MRAIFHPEAGVEFQHAIEVYQTESAELGLRFYRAVLTAVARIEAHLRLGHGCEVKCENVLCPIFHINSST